MNNFDKSQIITGDAQQVLSRIADNYIDCCVTSPPYYGLRDYGVDGQIGMEQTVKDYIENLVAIMREVKRVLRPDGTLWLNIGDAYAGSGKGRNADGSPSKGTSISRDRNALMGGHIKKSLAEGCKRKDLIGLPWQVAFALRDDGWYLRQDIIWHKPNTMPESVKDRCTKSHEYIFLLTKQPKYHFNADAIKEPCSQSSVADFVRRKTLDNKGRDDATSYFTVRPDLCRARDAYMPKDYMRNKRDVWTIPTKPFKGAHFAVFPEKLVEPCILAGCRKGGIVLDPFLGSGTTAVVAKKLQREYIGIDINPDYTELAKKRLENTYEQMEVKNELQKI